MVLGWRYSHFVQRGSVLPKIAVHRTPEGVQMFAARPGWKDVALLLMIMFFLTLFLFLLIFDPLRNQKQFTAVGGILTMGGALAEYGRRYLRQRRLDYASLIVRPWPIRLGATVTAKFQSKPLSLVRASLVCAEEVRTSAGKYESVNRALRYQLDLDPALKDSWEFDIPHEALPSFSVKSNKIQWMVKTVLDGECVADFELLVVPQVKK